QFAQEYFHKSVHRKVAASRPLYDLAMLVAEDDIAPPSNKRALKKFIVAGERAGFWVEVISPQDISRLPAFDALFIRENTAVNHHTYRFARRAQSEGLAVIDSPDAILRCNNKVYLAELLENHGIATPRTKIINRDIAEKVVTDIGYPVVVKVPDSTFSLGVKKASNEVEFHEIAKEMFERSDLLVVQEYLPTDFDWRIGILDNRPLFACKYFMARGHWQIYNWSEKKASQQSGDAECVAISDVPKRVVQLALRAVKLIGDGLYGVDVKEVNGRTVVIEVNENPNVDAGVEDKLTGDSLYLAIMNSLRDRVEARRARIERSVVM
ncbi:MAG: RimK family alpha-L-glutamate ligase, partial [Bdellovibrionales bacterium]|nr:RimK family alpha-L-glutamate ligase [Bdellovibrionales bacterium]